MNKLLSSVRNFLNSLTRYQFYQALAIFFGILIVITGIFGFFYYRSLNSLYEQFDTINEQRKTTRKILDRKQRITHQRQEIDLLLAQDATFNIAQYVTDLLAQVGLDQKSIIEPPTSEEKDSYRSDTLRLTLSHITMKELTVLLQEIEKKERIYLTDIDIKKLPSPVSTLDVSLTLMTWHLMTKTESEPEGASS